MTDKHLPAKTVNLAFTGASGAQYGLRLLQCLVAAGCRVNVMISRAAQVVIATETDLKLPGTPPATGTLSALATGASNNLIERAGDVALKERRTLILVPREAPFSEVHLENMLKLTRMGAVIMPASPGFYHKPQSIEDLVDFIVARILDHLNLPQDLMPRWGEARAEDKRKG